jgi:hypothetical protein
MKLLQISSCLFSTVIIAAYYTKNNIYHHLYLLLLIFGIFNHGLERKNDNSKNIIHNIDRTVAKITFFYTLYDTYNYLLVRIILFYVLIIYFLEYKYSKYDLQLHFIIHLHIILCMNIYLLLYKNKNELYIE